MLRGSELPGLPGWSGRRSRLAVGIVNDAERRSASQNFLRSARWPGVAEPTAAALRAGPQQRGDFERHLGQHVGALRPFGPDPSIG